MTKRRSILRWFLLAPGALYVGVAGCRKSSDKKKDTNTEPSTSPEFLEQLLHLCLVFGPWSEDEREEASAFYKTILREEHNEKKIEAHRADAALIEELWKQHWDSGMAIAEVSAATDEQFRVLSSVVSLAHSSGFTYNEARFKAAGVPLPGVCQGPVWAVGSPPPSEDG